MQPEGKGEIADFDRLSHGEQLPILLELATRATFNYALPTGLTVTMIRVSESAT